jgi:hypothetical protein
LDRGELPDPRSDGRMPSKRCRRFAGGDQRQDGSRAHANRCVRARKEAYRPRSEKVGSQVLSLPETVSRPVRERTRRSWPAPFRQRRRARVRVAKSASAAVQLFFQKVLDGIEQLHTVFFYDDGDQEAGADEAVGARQVGLAKTLTPFLLDDDEGMHSGGLPLYNRGYFVVGCQSACPIGDSSDTVRLRRAR